MGWTARAACRDVDPELFFPSGDARPARLQEQRALQVCSGCPVREPCREWALALQPVGVWGGTTAVQRGRLNLGAVRRS